MQPRQHALVDAVNKVLISDSGQNVLNPTHKLRGGCLSSQQSLHLCIGTAALFATGLHVIAVSQVQIHWSSLRFAVNKLHGISCALST
jgi:hypothetical protein